jgi:hypothetical protein
MFYLDHRSRDNRLSHLHSNTEQIDAVNIYIYRSYNKNGRYSLHCNIVLCCLSCSDGVIMFAICTTSFSIQQFHVLPTQGIYVLCVDVRANSDYFPTQHLLTGFYNRDGVFTARYGLDLYIPPGLTFSNSAFCRHSVFMCFVWISEQTAIISPYSIN